MDYFKINGRDFGVLVIDITETFNILYSENSGRTIADGAPMVLDPLGTFYGHKIKVKKKQGYEREYDELFEIISKPRYDGLLVEAAHNQKTISYRAYISNGSRSVLKINQRTRNTNWGEMELNIVPMKAQVLP